MGRHCLRNMTYSMRKYDLFYLYSIILFATLMTLLILFYLYIRDVRHSMRDTTHSRVIPGLPRPLPRKHDSSHRNDITYSMRDTTHSYVTPGIQRLLPRSNATARWCRTRQRAQWYVCVCVCACACACACVCV